MPITQDRPYVERGLASWYGRKFHGRRTASGEPYDMYAMTAAHPTLPIPSYARVRNPANGREVVVRVNDRGPFHPGRIIDLSYTAALKLDLLRGVAPVEVRAHHLEEIRAGSWRRGGPMAPEGAGEGPKAARARRPGSMRAGRGRGGDADGVCRPAGSAAGDHRFDSGRVGSDQRFNGGPPPAFDAEATAMADGPRAAPKAAPPARSTRGPAGRQRQGWRSSPSASRSGRRGGGARRAGRREQECPRRPRRPHPLARLLGQLGAFRQREGAAAFQRRVAAALRMAVAAARGVDDDASLFRLQAGPREPGRRARRRRDASAGALQPVR